MYTPHKRPTQSTTTIVRAISVRNFSTLTNRWLGQLGHQLNVQHTKRMVLLLIQRHNESRWQNQRHKMLFWIKEERKRKKLNSSLNNVYRIRKTMNLTDSDKVILFPESVGLVIMWVTTECSFDLNFIFFISKTHRKWKSLPVEQFHIACYCSST